MPSLIDHLSFIVCEDCEEVYDGDCPIHGPLRCLDPSVGWDKDSMAYTTVPVPAQLTVKTSDIIDAGEVFRIFAIAGGGKKIEY